MVVTRLTSGLSSLGLAVSGCTRPPKQFGMPHPRSPVLEVLSDFVILLSEAGKPFA
jgi:hypothetical protein